MRKFSRKLLIAANLWLILFVFQCSSGDRSSPVPFDEGSPFVPMDWDGRSDRHPTNIRLQDL